MFFLAVDFWQSVLGVVRVVFIVFDALFFIGFVFAFRKAWAFKPRIRLKEKHPKRTLTLRTAVFRERWQLVMRQFSIGSPESLRLSIIEADAVVDAVLKDIGLQGEHMADRLAKVNPDSLTTLNRLWRAHRLRNELVHTPGFSLSPQDARATLNDYESFLKEIGILAS